MESDYNIYFHDVLRLKTNWFRNFDFTVVFWGMWISENLEMMQRIVECSVENKLANTKLNAKFLNGVKGNYLEKGFLYAKEKYLNIVDNTKFNTWFLVCLFIPLLWPGLFVMLCYKFM